MPMFLYGMLFIGWSPLWTVLATRLTRQAGPVIRPDIENWLMLWRTSKNLTTLGWSLNSIWHSSRTCQYAYFPWYVLLTKWWISLWDLSDCGVWRLGLPSITIVLLHYRLIGESLKTTNRNYMRGLGGREAARAGRQYMYGRRMLNGI